MARAFLKVVFSALVGIANFLFGPIFNSLDVILHGMNIDNYLNNFNTIITTYVVPFVGWFVDQIPPFTFEVILLEFSFTVAYFTLSFTFNLLLKTLKLIKKLPIA